MLLRHAVLGLVVLLLGHGMCGAADGPRTKILFIGKNPDHAYGSHMYMHTSGMLAACAELTGRVDPIVSNGWPQDAKAVDGVKAIVVYTTPAAAGRSRPRSDIPTGISRTSRSEGWSSTASSGPQGWRCRRKEPR